MQKRIPALAPFPFFIAFQWQLRSPRQEQTKASEEEGSTGRGSLEDRLGPTITSPTTIRKAAKAVEVKADEIGLKTRKMLTPQGEGVEFLDKAKVIQLIHDAYGLTDVGKERPLEVAVTTDGSMLCYIYGVAISAEHILHPHQHHPFHYRTVHVILRFMKMSSPDSRIRDGRGSAIRTGMVVRGGHDEGAALGYIQYINECIYIM
eukprot:scaffold73782_cov67-Attheya_sp.AAC.2